MIFFVALLLGVGSSWGWADEAFVPSADRWVTVRTVRTEGLRRRLQNRRARPTLVVLPGAKAELRRQAEEEVLEAGRDSWVSISIFVPGTVDGLRLGVHPHLDLGPMRLRPEIFAGGGWIPGGFAPILGAGMRFDFMINPDRDADGFLFSPGLHFVLALGDDGEDPSFLDFQPDSNLYILGTTVEIGYYRQFARHLGWEIIGVRGGLNVAVAGLDPSGEDATGRVVPELSLQTGLWF